MKFKFTDLAIVLAVKNAAVTVADSIESIRFLLQNGAVLYVFDSMSTDMTKSAIMYHAPRAIYRCEPDNGLYYAWNRALATINEKFVFFLNADDSVISPHCFYEMYKKILVDKQLVAVHSKTCMLRTDGKVRTAGAPVKKNILYTDMPVITIASIFNKEKLLSVGAFDVRYSISADYDLLSRLLINYGHDAFSFYDCVLVKFSLDGMSNRNRKHAFFEVGRIIKKHHGLLYYMLFMMWRSFNESKRFILKLYFRFFLA